MVLTALCVGALAIDAGAVSFSHMRELAGHHGQLGWKSYAFPVSVDGLEIVASLYLVAQRRAGRHTGWVPWAALVVSTLASLAANVAVGGADPIGKALAGWPALSMLVSVKLLFAMFDHGGVDQRTGVADDQRTSGTAMNVPGDVPQSGRDDVALSGTVPAERTEILAPSVTGPAGRSAVPASLHDASPARDGEPDERAVPIDVDVVARLIPAARAARSLLVSDGRSLSRDNLADAMRDDGHGVSNERASLLLKILKTEHDVTTIDRASIGRRPREVEVSSEVAG